MLNIRRPLRSDHVPYLHTCIYRFVRSRPYRICDKGVHGTALQPSCHRHGNCQEKSNCRAQHLIGYSRSSVTRTGLDDMSRFGRHVITPRFEVSLGEPTPLAFLRQIEKYLSEKHALEYLKIDPQETIASSCQTCICDTARLL